MAKVYDSIGGKPFQEWLAREKYVQADLFVRTREMASDAAILLHHHRAQGHSFIQIEHGEIDYHIILNDTRGQKAAMSIEFGRRPRIPFERHGAMEGLRILHISTGLGGD